MGAMGNARDVALVLSGGSINGTLMELGFLRRVRESELWHRTGWIFGTSAGALAGTMAALDRLDDLEEFLMALQPEDAFRPTRLWRLPLLGTHDYMLPETIATRIGDLDGLAEQLARAPMELVVCATDVTDATGGEDPPDYELVYSSRTTPPSEFARAILASAAMSALVLPLRVGDRIATDGSWVRNYPLAHAYHRPEVRLIVAFRYVPSYGLPGEPFARLRRRLERFRRVPPVRALLLELEEADIRRMRNEPPHLLDMIGRLMRITVVRNTVMEERLADEKDASISELAALRTDVARLLRQHVGDPLERERLAREIDARFTKARFPFVHDRLVPRITVRGGIGAISLEAATRRPRPWADDLKRGLIRRGYAFAEAELRRHGVRVGSATAA